MRDINWAQVLVFGLVALVVFALGIGVLFLLSGRAFGMMGWGTRRGWCPMCGGTGRIGWLGGLIGLTLTCLLPLGVLALVAVGAFWLARNTG